MDTGSPADMLAARHKEILMILSVIIPYYNPDGDPQTDAMLKRAVISARDNLDGIADYEIIVVNDGSQSDPEPAFDTPVIRYIRREHGMLGAARNTGIENARGEYISFLDADDIYLPGTLGHCLRAIREYDADLLGFGMKRISPGDRAESPSGAPCFNDPVTGDEFMSAHNLPGSSCRYIIRMSLIKDHGLRFMENAFIEDEEFTPRLMFFSQRYVETAYPVYGYCIRSGSIITSSSARMIQARSADTLKALDRLINFRSEHESSPHTGLDRKISYLALDHIRRTLRRNDWRSSSREQISSLTSMGLFPLKCSKSSPGFRLYSLLSRCGAGRLLLRLADKIYR